MNYSTFSNAWINEIRTLQRTGERVSPRGMQTAERRWSQIEVANSMSFPVVAQGRSFRDVIGILEGLSLVGGVSVPEAFTDRVKKFGDFMDDGVLHGAYGTRASGKLGEVVRLMERDPDTRQAVVTVFDSDRDLNRQKKDIPCTVALHFMKRGDDLELNVTMRSNDIWLGTPYDFTQFAVAQASVAQALGLWPGKYVHSAGSLHLYERDYAAVADIGYLSWDSEMGFPLWGGPSDIGAITTRARYLLLWPESFSPETMFEVWARNELMK